jgi:orotidine-5'-phosphate decarboxylase
VPVILDAKRGDIGATAEHYAREAFERYEADAVTLSPFMGLDSIEPYLKHADRGVFVLCRTSNAGGDDLQMLDVGGERLYERIARLAAGPWHRPGQLGLVVGATYPAELARVRALVGDLPLLVPGIGVQGGDVAASVRAGQTADGTGMVINSSRAILYAGDGADFDVRARAAARQTRDEINRWRGR